GSRFVFLGDEIYLLAGLPLPPAAAYEDFAIAEDGIGLVRRFEDAFARSVARTRKPIQGRAVTVVSGEMFAPRLVSLLGGVGIDTDTVRVAAVPNDFFGRAIGVAGLPSRGRRPPWLRAPPRPRPAPPWPPAAGPCWCPRWPCATSTECSSTIRLPRTWRAISACPCGSWRRRRARSSGRFATPEPMAVRWRA